MTSDEMRMDPGTEEVMLKDDDFRDLEQRYAMHVLLMVYRYPGCLKADIADLTDPVHNTKYSRIHYLIENGYIRYMNVNGKATKKLQLTDKGRRIAECVDRMHEILRECD